MKKIEPEKKYQTFLHLLNDKNMQLLVSNSFHNKSMDDMHYRLVFNTGRVTMATKMIYVDEYKNLSDNNVAIEGICSDLKHLMDYDSISSYYYIMTEELMTHYFFYQGGYLNFFMIKMQNLMDLSFETGLTQYWEVVWKYVYKVDLPKNSKIAEEEFIKFRDLIQLFVVLPFGYAIALVVFLGEIVYGKLRNQQPCLRFKCKGIARIAKRKLIISQDDKDKLTVSRIIHRRFKLKRLNRKNRLKRKMFFITASDQTTRVEFKISITSTKQAAIEVFRLLGAIQDHEKKLALKAQKLEKNNKTREDKTGEGELEVNPVQEKKL
jgi:hypothetical protein